MKKITEDLVSLLRDAPTGSTCNTDTKAYIYGKQHNNNNNNTTVQTKASAVHLVGFYSCQLVISVRAELEGGGGASAPARVAAGVGDELVTPTSQIKCHFDVFNIRRCDAVTL